MFIRAWLLSLFVPSFPSLVLFAGCDSQVFGLVMVPQPCGRMHRVPQRACKSSGAVRRAWAGRRGWLSAAGHLGMPAA